jgi:uncharacterized protein YkwD
MTKVAQILCTICLLAFAGIGAVMTSDKADAAQHRDETASQQHSQQHSGQEAAQSHSHARDQLNNRMLAVHNKERIRLGLPALKWNPALVHKAREWGEHLAQKGYLQHSTEEFAPNVGENLWMGSSGYWQVEDMIGMFIAERQNYRHDRFPNVSDTGNWKDVGHYTQIVWRDTRELGCALVMGNGKDVLVCHYFPAGNVHGRRAF